MRFSQLLPLGRIFNSHFRFPSFDELFRTPPIEKSWSWSVSLGEADTRIGYGPTDQDLHQDWSKLAKSATADSQGDWLICTKELRE